MKTRSAPGRRPRLRGQAADVVAERVADQVHERRVEEPTDARPPTGDRDQRDDHDAVAELLEMLDHRHRARALLGGAATEELREEPACGRATRQPPPEGSVRRRGLGVVGRRRSPSVPAVRRPSSTSGSSSGDARRSRLRRPPSRRLVVRGSGLVRGVRGRSSASGRRGAIGIGGGGSGVVTGSAPRSNFTMSLTSSWILRNSLSPVPIVRAELGQPLGAHDDRGRR